VIIIIGYIIYKYYNEVKKWVIWSVNTVNIK
jgi:hypothetical protein